MSTVLPRNYLYGIILFTLFVVGGSAMLAEFSKSDPTYLQDDKFTEFNKSFNVMEDVETQVDSLQDGIEGASTDFGLFGVLNSLISSAWQTLKLLFSSLSFMTSVYLGMNTVFGVPLWVGGLIGMLVTVLIAFAIYSAIFQREI